MGQLLRTGRWISFTLVALAAIIGFAILSNWQWHRAQQEQAKSAAVEAGALAAPVPIEDVVAPGAPLPAADEWRTVTAAGVLDCRSGFLVRNRPMDSVNGLWAACPLITDDGAVLWVNRGWLAASGPATAAVAMPASTVGPVLVEGRLRPGQDGPAAIPDDLPAGQTTHLDTGLLTSVAGLPGPSYVPYVEATATTPADPGGLRALPLPPAESAQNFSYAGQWLLFAAIAVGGWFFFLRREALEDAQASSAEEPQPTR